MLRQRVVITGRRMTGASNMAAAAATSIATALAAATPAKRRAATTARIRRAFPRAQWSVTLDALC